MFVIIDLYSNNLSTLKNFNFYILNSVVFKKLNVYVGFDNKQTKTKNFTLLKSPHVNKTAQEQFNLNYYKTKVVLFSPSLLLVLFYIKNIKYKLFPDLNMKIKTCSNKFLFFKKLNNCFNPKQYSIEEFKHKEFSNYLKITESFGESSFFNV